MIEEPVPNQKLKLHCITLHEGTWKILCPTSSKTKKGAISKAWTRLSNSAGARFYDEYKQVVLKESRKDD